MGRRALSISARFEPRRQFQILIEHCSRSACRRRRKDFRVALKDEPAPFHLFHHLDDIAFQRGAATSGSNLNPSLPYCQLGRKHSDTATLLLHFRAWHRLMEQPVVGGFDFGLTVLYIPECPDSYAILGIEGCGRLGIPLAPGFGEGRSQELRTRRGTYHW